MIYPAIDLIDGGCVRLFKGKFDAQTSYDVFPVDVARQYAEQGADWIHVVDLDGARDSKNRQSQLIGEIVSSSGLLVQTGGGVRGVEDVARLLDLGAARVVIGSLAVKDPDCVRECFSQFGAEKICLAVDVIPDGDQYQVAVSGWQEQSGVYLSAILDMYLDCGLTHVLCTDISRDGTLGGCNLDLYGYLVRDYPSLQVQASGGVSDVEDVVALNGLNVGGVIIGKALYEGKINLKDLIGDGVSEC
ncbi:MAG: 1-(5-phosphoribosyl)-5-[(5-phosphoribosylamino)methylideneamino]imidazole-4-carboxamide isomerase [Alphaproteobacteria bacterium]|nr:1-(5-phosphoribosyl)-5-[(5-phosphoribosylamino)methylideneamino]imidazole-4-carboxamide isomerase [Alphaproteobacteria bacterium]MCB9985045.1 1-(5-phosphoribosyl)-5-[(5-phosphoribosylamino)methylideneamino]imidazole-4-carboxamide isomerase [Micavibrio sp.]